MTWEFVDDDDGYNVVQTVNATELLVHRLYQKTYANLTCQLIMF